jgi:hypothetical protein
MQAALGDVSGTGRGKRLRIGDINRGAFQRDWHREPPDLSFLPHDEVAFTLTAVVGAAALRCLVLGTIAAICPGLVRGLAATELGVKEKP